MAETKTATNVATKELAKDVRKINLFAKKMKNKETKEEFYSYFTQTKDGDFVTVRFTKEVKVQPKESCTILVKDAFLDYAPATNKRKFPCFWISKIDKVLELEVEKYDCSEFFD